MQMFEATNHHQVVIWVVSWWKAWPHWSSPRRYSSTWSGESVRWRYCRPAPPLPPASRPRLQRLKSSRGLWTTTSYPGWKLRYWCCLYRARCNDITWRNLAEVCPQGRTPPGTEAGEWCRGCQGPAWTSWCPHIRPRQTNPAWTEQVVFSVNSV